MAQPDDPRAAVPIDEGTSIPVGLGETTSFDITRLDFGHHAGRTIADLAKEDPEYLAWLARRSVGCPLPPRDCSRDGVGRAERERLAPLTSERSRF